MFSRYGNLNKKWYIYGGQDVGLREIYIFCLLINSKFEGFYLWKGE